MEGVFEKGGIFKGGDVFREEGIKERGRLRKIRPVIEMDFVIRERAHIEKDRVC